MSTGVGIFGATTVLGILGMFGVLSMTGLLGMRLMNWINSIPGVSKLHSGWGQLARLWGKFWLRAHPLQAVAETLILAIGWSLPFLALEYIHTPGAASTQPHTLATLLGYLPALVLLDGPACVLWLVFRLRMRHDRWRLDVALDALIGAVVSVALAAIILITAFYLTPQGVFFAQRLNMPLDAQHL